MKEEARGVRRKSGENTKERENERIANKLILKRNILFLYLRKKDRKGERERVGKWRDREREKGTAVING